jgi:hypothetical protein
VDNALLWAVVMLILGALSTWTALKVAKISRGVASVERSVNHVAHGSPTLIQRVTRMEDASEARWGWTADSVESIAREVGAELPPKPPTPTHEEAA